MTTTNNLKFEIRESGFNKIYIYVNGFNDGDSHFLFKDGTILEWGLAWNKQGCGNVGEWATSNVYYATKEEAQATIDKYNKVNKFPGIAIKVGNNPKISEIVQKYLFSLGYDWYNGCVFNGNKVNICVTDYIYCRKTAKELEFTSTNNTTRTWDCDHVIDMTTKSLPDLFKLFEDIKLFPTVLIDGYTVKFNQDKSGIEIGCRKYEAEQIRLLYTDLRDGRFNHELLVNSTIMLKNGKVETVVIENIAVLYSQIETIYKALYDDAISK